LDPEQIKLRSSQRWWWWWWWRRRRRVLLSKAWCIMLFM